MKLPNENILEKIMQKSAAAHNAIYRGVNVTDIFYDGTLSEEIAAGTFDDVFPGDYIIGQSSGNVYLIANLDYNYLCGDTSCTTHHLCLVPLAIMGSEQMNTSNITTGGYVGSNMYTTILDTYRATIQADFGTDHILTVRRHLTNAVTNGYPSNGTWYDSDIDLMNENMVYGSKIFATMPAYNGSSITIPNNYTADKSQLAIFRHRPDLIVAYNDSGSRQIWWLRDVVSASFFSCVYSDGGAAYDNASNSHGVRPVFAIY